MNARTLIAFAWDVAMAMLAWAAAFWLLFDFTIPASAVATMAQGLPYVAAVHAAIFFAFGLQRGLWRYAGVLELRRMVLESTPTTGSPPIPAWFESLRLRWQQCVVRSCDGPSHLVDMRAANPQVG